MPQAFTGAPQGAIWGYDPTTRLWLPVQVAPLVTDTVTGEEYAPMMVNVSNNPNIGNFPSSGNSFNLLGSQAFPVGTNNSPVLGVAGSSRGAIVYLNVTNINAGTIQVAIQGQDAVSGNWYTIFQDAFAISINGFFTFVLYPGIAALASTSGTVPGNGALRGAVSQALTATWRVALIVATAAVTASVNVGLQI